MVYNILNQCSGGAEAMFSGYFQVSTVLTQLCDWTVFSWWGQKHFHQRIIWNQSLLPFIDQKPDLIWQYNISSMPWFEDKDVCICERTLQQNLWHSLSKSPLSGTSDLSQSEIMSDLILSQDGIDAVWLQIWKLGPDHHYITHHENQHPQTSKI